MDSIAWYNHEWLPAAQATLPLDDVGVLQGAVLVERLRTVRGEPLDVEQHLSRMQFGCELLEIHPPRGRDWIGLLGEVVRECASRNRAVFGAQDFSLVVIVTPGRIGESPRLPTMIVHAAPIRWPQLKSFYRVGQPLIVANTRNVPQECWLPQLKTRSRLHYYLADSEAAELAQPWGGAVLLDLAGNLTETSMANLLVVEGKRIVSPPLNSILHGVSLTRTLRLAVEMEYDVALEQLSSERAQAADEILLCGSTGCLWPAASLEDRIFDDPVRRPVFQHLSRAWCDDISLDYVQQAS
ncbi:aminotransferase class IV [Aureliella helgolandensis]|uniref:Branched-chain-amino-acid aminotransferase n=1 Tax=Aureliella helgolandensis TaxID=2527968 RepID=A0A518G0B6_9BACT|nr:aminotransferase class IV [Aureliella helgolandensis]QDV22045.1 Branched-chain-amino-acid aminotransferase [Aureliella helgolandensis]